MGKVIGEIPEGCFVCRTVGIESTATLREGARGKLYFHCSNCGPDNAHGDGRQEALEIVRQRLEAATTAPEPEPSQEPSPAPEPAPSSEQPAEPVAPKKRKWGTLMSGGAKHG